MTYGSDNQTELNPAKETLKRLLTGRFVGYRPMVARSVGGAVPGLFLCQLLYWSERTTDDAGWIYKTQEEWEEETVLTRREQETARKHLRRLGVIEEHNARLEHRLYYRVLWDALFELLFSDVQAAVPSRMAEPDIGEGANVQTGLPRMAETDTRGRPKRTPDPLAETTTEMYAENARARDIQPNKNGNFGDQEYVYGIPGGDTQEDHQRRLQEEVDSKRELRARNRAERELS